jgi:hypothetical protein
MSATTSRRAVLAGAATAIAASTGIGTAGIVSTKAMESDPIFAAMKTHRAAFIREMETGDIKCNLEDGTPEHQAADAAETIASDALDDAEDGLLLTEPTTMAGVLALLAYVDDVFTQKIVHPTDPSNWHSSHTTWGHRTDDDIVDLFDGEPIKLPFTFWIMRNIRTALEAMSVQS